MKLWEGINMNTYTITLAVTVETSDDYEAFQLAKAYASALMNESEASIFASIVDVRAV